MKKSYGSWADKQLELVGVVERLLHEFVVSAGMDALSIVLERERTEVCGPRYRRGRGRSASRTGHAAGELVLGGRRVRVMRPRARSRDGKEIVLPSWRQFSDEDPLRERALEQMLVGVSTRKYDRSLEPVAASIKTRGTRKSAVSSRYVAITTARMKEWLERDLSSLNLVVAMIDGVRIADHVMIVAVGVDAQGNKHVLGIREGATENAAVCTELLCDLRTRGMSTESKMLFVLDGSKALRKAVVEVFGNNARIQRCQIHKIRNVRDQLPEYMRSTVSATMRQAYRCNNVVHARKLLQNLARTLRADHPSAAASVEEGLEETLTVMGLRLPRGLERVLSTTNIIENLIGSTRDLSYRVKRWRDGQMIVRWTATAVQEASKQFRRIAGYKEMPRLVAALRDHEALEREEKVA
jgi:transposase-like protein